MTLVSCCPSLFLSKIAKALFRARRPRAWCDASIAMAPKAKRAPKAKAGTVSVQHKGKTKGSKTAASPTRKAKAKASAVSTSAPSTEQRRSAVTGRVLKPWRTMDSVDRIIRSKLAGYDESELRLATGETSGMSVRDYIAAELRRNKPRVSYLSQKFWDKFHVEFPLGSVRFRDTSSSDDPDQARDVPDDLVLALDLAQDENPTKRKPDALLNYLKYCGKLNLTSLRLILFNSREGPYMTLRDANKQRVALLKYIAEKQLYHTYPNFWAKIERDMDEVFSVYLESKNVDENIRSEWIQGNAAILTPILPLTELLIVEEAMREKVPPPIAALRQVLRTKTGLVLYKDESVKLQYRMYLGRVDDRLRQLEDLSFADDDWDSFNTLLRQDPHPGTNPIPHPPTASND